jgi:transcriptional regulator with XRE-family HTH domain
MARHEAREIQAETSLADHIRQAARESGLSVYQLAIDAQVDQSNLNKFLNGSRKNLSLDTLDRLFRVLGIRVVRRKQAVARGQNDS